MTDYLKKILFSLLILVMTVPYMNSASKAMDGEDYDGSTVRARRVSFVVEDQQEAQSFTKQHSQVMSLEDSRVSWTSYVPSSVKSIAQNAYDILDYTTRNPKKSAIIGLFMAYQVTSAAADWYGVWCCANNTREFCGSVPVASSVNNCWKGITDLSPIGHRTLNDCISKCGRSSPNPFRCISGTALSLVRVNDPFFCVPE